MMLHVLSGGLILSSPHFVAARIPSVLSIQSHVVYGAAGNSAAVFPMRRLGANVWPLNTVTPPPPATPPSSFLNRPPLLLPTGVGRSNPIRSRRLRRRARDHTPGPGSGRGRRSAWELAAPADRTRGRTVHPTVHHSVAGSIQQPHAVWRVGGSPDAERTDLEARRRHRRSRCARAVRRGPLGLPRHDGAGRARARRCAQGQGRQPRGGVLL